MTAPGRPYVTANQVGILLQSRFYGSMPTSSTTPSDTVIDQIIPWVEGIILGRFHSVGYKIPFLELSGETWPLMQTQLLQFMTVMGSAAMAGGHILKPAPMMGPGQRGTGSNVFTEAVDALMDQISTHGYRFRAQYYVGSKAEKWIANPYGPRLDFLEDYWDPTRYQLLKAYTDEIAEVFDDMALEDLSWDYVYNLRTAA